MNRLLPDWRQAGSQAVAAPAPEHAAQSTPGPSAHAAALVCTSNGTGMCWERVNSNCGCSGSALTSRDSFLR